MIDEAHLDAIEARWAVGNARWSDGSDMRAVLAALRAAWSEREEWADHILMLSKAVGMLTTENERYRAALEQWETFADDCIEHRIVLPIWEALLFDECVKATRAALAAPGAREETTP